MYSMEIETHTAFEGVENGINPAMQRSLQDADYFLKKRGSQ